MRHRHACRDRDGKRPGAPPPARERRREPHEGQTECESRDGEDARRPGRQQQLDELEARNDGVSAEAMLIAPTAAVADARTDSARGRANRMG
jgi:hypothetical protein